MTDQIFWWIGYVATAFIAICIVGFAMLWLWVNLIHERFGAILFRPTQRRLSVASWHQHKLVGLGDGDWKADDWPIAPRPFYLSYRFGKRRVFIMLGVMEQIRHSSIKGTHP